MGVWVCVMPRELKGVKWASEISAFIGQPISANIEISISVGFR